MRPVAPNFQPVRQEFGKIERKTEQFEKKIEGKMEKVAHQLHIEPGSMLGYVLVAAFLMMAFACWMPFYLAIQMLMDVHFRMWIGISNAMLAVILCFLMPVLFAVAIWFILTKGHGEGLRTEETMVLVGVTFCSLLGIMLCILSVPMSTGSASTISLLSFGCDLDHPVSAKLVQYSQVLHNIRNSPNCTDKGSIKDCDGWKSNTWTNYLQLVENDFDCTGMCTLPAPPTATSQITPVVAPHPASGSVPQGDGAGATTGPQRTPEKGTFSTLIQTRMQLKRDTKDSRKEDSSTLNDEVGNLKMEEKRFLTQQSRSLSTSNKTMSSSQMLLAKSSWSTPFNDAPIPAPMLYSKDKTDQKCYPLIADRLQVISTQTGEVLFCQGVGLLFVSVLAGAVKVMDKILFEGKEN